MENIKSKNDVIKLVSNIHEISFDEAKELVNETISMMIDEPWSASEIIMDQLGIEPDYIEYLIY